MASISTYKGASGDALRAIQFMGSDKKRRSIRLGTLPAIVAAGVTTWRRLFHNLRFSRQNELLELGYKRKAVCAWMGNSEAVADKNYEAITAADWARAGAVAPDFAPPTEKVSD